MSDSIRDSFLEEVAIDLGITQEDDGIGSYEYWGATGFDSRPYLSATCSGQVTLTWVVDTNDKPDAIGTQSFLVEEGGFDLTITLTPVGACEIEETETGFQVTQTFDYDGEGEKDGRFEPDRD